MPNTEEEAKPSPRATPRWLTIRDRPGQLSRLALGIICIAVVLGIWFFLTVGERPEDRIVGPVTLPSISETVSSFPALWFDRALARSAFTSLARVLGGFLLAASIAVPIGVIASCYPRFDAFLKPVTIFGRNIPVAALIAISLVWFGTGELQKVMFIFIAAVSFIIFDTARSVDAISNRYLDTAYTLGARKDRKKGALKSLYAAAIYMTCFGLGFAWIVSSENHISMVAVMSGAKFWLWSGGAGLVGFLLWQPVLSHQAISKVLLPLAMPQIVNSMRLLFGLAFGYIMLAEAINPKLGLGHIIFMSQRKSLPEHLYLSLMVIALLAFAIDRIVLFAQKRFFPYVENG